MYEEALFHIQEYAWQRGNNRNTIHNTEINHIDNKKKLIVSLHYVNILDVLM